MHGTLTELTKKKEGEWPWPARHRGTEAHCDPELLDVQLDAGAAPEHAHEALDGRTQRAADTLAQARGPAHWLVPPTRASAAAAITNPISDRKKRTVHGHTPPRERARLLDRALDVRPAAADRRPR